MKMTASTIAFFVLTLAATSVLARPPVPSYSFEEYTDNNILGSIPADTHDEDHYEPEEILEM